MYLPPEILSIILCHESKTVLKNARLVCKAYEGVATRFLFKDMFVFPRYADMEKSTLLASRFGSYVKTLIVSSEYFDPGITWNNFVINIPDTNMAHSCYKTYRRLQHEQEEILKAQFPFLLKAQFPRHVSSILGRLFNLQSVLLTDRKRESQLCWCQQAYFDGHSRSFDPFQYDYHSGLKSLRSPPKHNCVTSVNSSLHAHPGYWPQLLGALYLSGNTSIKKIATDFCSSGLTVSDLCMMPPRLRYCAGQVLPNLTSLHLHLNVDFMDHVEVELWYDVEDELCTEKVVAEFLSAAINLTSLDIDLQDNIITYEDEENFSRPITFEMILGGCKMPRLVTLGLINFLFTEASLTTFLQHSQGIQHMSIENARMISESWASMFQSIKGSLALKTVELGRLYGVTQEFPAGQCSSSIFERYPPIQKYLLGDGPSPFSGAGLEHGDE